MPCLVVIKYEPQFGYASFKVIVKGGKHQAGAEANRVFR